MQNIFGVYSSVISEIASIQDIETNYFLMIVTARYSKSRISIIGELTPDPKETKTWQN